ncbi:uncharacterized protein K452DRAFT_232609 [Aplosporella prunicola CBS 121167]|uniref:Uncharacterized protein n=1 Tax=Aplosporella prunicola CBS 121167 TaxID=1176127 RepID=A0A6A6B536_9PEZI|nr:uncharacterized protein K452DRAFT_232609 [Aplosporella prunicola CBS 121167]KAF2139262.1 hypothetical protein K452DRAFT_232609 [Aplosporella prunicola CBS 121167]
MKQQLRRSLETKPFEITAPLGQHEGNLRPALFPCHTTHSQFFPKRRSLPSSYLLPGVVVGLKDNHWYHGSFLSIGTLLQPSGLRGSGCSFVQSSDYLERSTAQTDRKTRLSQYLQSQGVLDDAWHHAYLVTAPRFLGYSFNPVSFWYIYTADCELKMMILEINNTFGEGGIHLLKPDMDEQGGFEDGKPTILFTDDWQKDLHISPFSSHEDSYSLMVVDPFRSEAFSQVDNIIILKSLQGHTKLVTRVFSEFTLNEPSAATALDGLNFIMRWWSVGIVTFLRILKEACELFIKRKLKDFLRLEVAPDGVPRDATATEQLLETFFRRYLQHVVHHARKPVKVIYRPPPSVGQAQEFEYWDAAKGNATDILEITVLNPVFYSRFIRYTHTSEALDREGIFTDERKKTVRISNPQFFSGLPLGHWHEETENSRAMSFTNRLGWEVLRRLRCPPADSAARIDQCEDIRAKPLAPLDEHVQQRCGDSKSYRQCLIKSFLAQRFTGGFTELVELLELAFRVCLVAGGFATTNSTSLLTKTVAASSIHAWSLVKSLF